MAEDKDFADRNAHDRTPADEPNEPASRESDDRAAAKPKKDDKNPLDRLRFGSAGSGGAEFEPGPERP